MNRYLILGFLMALMIFSANVVNAGAKEIADPADLLPADEAIPGFNLEKSKWQNITPTGIYDYMDGAGDLFLEYGFERGCAAEYSGKDERVAVELFKMKSGDAAFGIYSLNNYASESEKQDDQKYKINDPGSKAVKDLKGDNFTLIKDKAIEFFKGDIYGRIAIDKEDRFTLMSFTNTILADIPKHSSRPSALGKLPVMDRIPGSERYAVGLVGMNQLLDLGKGDIWGLKSGAQIVAGEYRLSNGVFYQVIVVIHKNPAISEDKYNGLKSVFNDMEGYKPTALPSAGGQNVLLVRTPSNDYLGFRLVGDRIEIFKNIGNPSQFKMILAKDQSISVRNPKK